MAKNADLQEPRRAARHVPSRVRIIKIIEQPENIETCCRVRFQIMSQFSQTNPTRGYAETRCLVRGNSKPRLICLLGYWTHENPGKLIIPRNSVALPLCSVLHSSASRRFQTSVDSSKRGRRVRIAPFLIASLTSKTTASNLSLLLGAETRTLVCSRLYVSVKSAFERISDTGDFHLVELCGISRFCDF